MPPACNTPRRVSATGPGQVVTGSITAFPSLPTIQGTSLIHDALILYFLVRLLNIANRRLWRYIERSISLRPITSGGLAMIASVIRRSYRGPFLGLVGPGWVLLLVAGFMLARADEPSKTDAALRAAREARRTDRYDAATRQLESFRALGGAREAARMEKALMGAQKGDIAPVEKYLRGLLEKKDRPEAASILEALTRGYLENLQFVETQACLKEWSETKPSDAQGFYLRGRALAELPSGVDNWGRRVAPPEAIKDYRRALDLDPQHEGA